MHERREGSRVWNITPGGSVPKAEIPRQVLIGHNTGCEAVTFEWTVEYALLVRALYVRETGLTMKARLCVIIMCPQYS